MHIRSSTVPMLPRNATTIEVGGYDEPLPLYFVDVDGQRAEYALAKPIHDQGDRVFRLQPALAQIEELVVADLRS